MTALFSSRCQATSGYRRSLPTTSTASWGHLDTRQFPDGETYLRFAATPRLGLSPSSAPSRIQTRNSCRLSLLPRLRESSVPLRSGWSLHIWPICGRMALQSRRGRDVAASGAPHLRSLRLDGDCRSASASLLGEIYSIPTRAVHAAPLISGWIRANIANPLIIGPDSESDQWVAAVANDVGAPHCVLEKVRHGDRDVQISLKDIDQWKGRTAVLVDDIISSGRTMIEAVRLLKSQGWTSPVCIAVHGLFADNSDALLAEAGARVVTTNSVGHATNEIDIARLLESAIDELATASP